MYGKCLIEALAAGELSNPPIYDHCTQKDKAEKGSFFPFPQSSVVLCFQRSGVQQTDGRPPLTSVMEVTVQPGIAQRGLCADACSWGNRK